MIHIEDSQQKSGKKINNQPAICGENDRECCGHLSKFAGTN